MESRCSGGSALRVVTVEKTPHEYVASCEELRAVASGATEQEALANPKEAIRALIDQSG